jgi:trehalose 6-phosphate phosphatase
VDGQIAQLVAPLIADPRHGAVVCDIDGTLAPIESRPDKARVPAATLKLLGRLASTYSLVACVTGRAAAEARLMVPVEGVAIAGNHGLEVWKDGAAKLEPRAAKYLEPMRTAVVMVENDGVLREYGCSVEDKGITFSVHFRNSPRADHATRYLETQIVPKLERAGLAANFGRMVLEVRPPIPVNKGTGVRALRGRRAISQLLFAGDDRSDLDAFAEATIKIAVASREAPPELIAAADSVLQGPAQVVELLRYLADEAAR